MARADVQINLESRDRTMDNVMRERLWRKVKDEDTDLWDSSEGVAVREGLTRSVGFYNAERPHQGLGGRTPAEAH